jgi:hypothetical protein
LGADGADGADGDAVAHTANTIAAELLAGVRPSTGQKLAENTKITITDA